MKYHNISDVIPTNPNQCEQSQYVYDFLQNSEYVTTFRGGSSAHVQVWQNKLTGQKIVIKYAKNEGICGNGNERLLEEGNQLHLIKAKNTKYYEQFAQLFYFDKNRQKPKIYMEYIEGEILGYYVAFGLMKNEKILDLLKDCINLIIENWYAIDIRELTFEEAKDDFYQLFVERPQSRIKSCIQLLSQNKDYEIASCELQTLKKLTINGKSYVNPFCASSGHIIHNHEKFYDFDFLLPSYAGYCHGDLTIMNMLVQQTNGSQQIRLIDNKGIHEQRCVLSDFGKMLFSFDFYYFVKSQVKSERIGEGIYQVDICTNEELMKNIIKLENQFINFLQNDVTQFKKITKENDLKHLSLILRCYSTLQYICDSPYRVGLNGHNVGLAIALQGIISFGEFYKELTSYQNTIK